MTTNTDLHGAMPERLTKPETVALYWAIAGFEDLIRAMRGMDFLPEQIEAERAKLVLAKRALRKVNKLRKQGL